VKTAATYHLRPPPKRSLGSMTCARAGVMRRGAGGAAGRLDAVLISMRPISIVTPARAGGGGVVSILVGPEGAAGGGVAGGGC